MSPLPALYRLVDRLAPPWTRRGGVLFVLRQARDFAFDKGPTTFLNRGLRPWTWWLHVRHYVGHAALIHPRPGHRPSLDDQYQVWLHLNRFSEGDDVLSGEELSTLPYQPLITVVCVPDGHHDPAALIASLQSQLYTKWEVCIAEAEPSPAGARTRLDDAMSDPRVRVKRGSSDNPWGAAVAMAAGDFVAPASLACMLKPQALSLLVRQLNAERADLMYADEDRRDYRGQFRRPFFKPGWSPELALTTNYVGEFFVARRELAEAATSCPLSREAPLHDLALRCGERAATIEHIAHPLFTLSLEHEGEDPAAARQVTEETLARRGSVGTVDAPDSEGQTRVRYPIDRDLTVSIVIPTRDRLDLLRKCVDSISDLSTYDNRQIVVVDNGSCEPPTLSYLDSLEGTVVCDDGAFNFSRLANLGAAAQASDFILFLNNDTEVISPDWIEAMLEHAAKPDVAAVGARLLYPDGTPQHEGVAVGWGGSAVNIVHGGYYGLGTTVRECTAVTGACLMIRRDVFEELGGFDEELGVVLQDVDLCLRARARGYRVVYTPFALLTHREGASRGKLHPQEQADHFAARWASVIQVDEYFSPNFSWASPLMLKLTPPS